MSYVLQSSRVQPVQFIKAHTICQVQQVFFYSPGKVGAYLLDSNFVVNAAQQPLNEPPRTQLYSEGIPAANLRCDE